MEDPFAKARDEKKQRVSHNKKLQKRNLEEAEKVANKPVSAGESSKDVKTAKRQLLQRSLIISKNSTASMGKFDQELKGEPTVKGKKRKVAGYYCL